MIKGEQTRNRILDTAARLFEQRGFAGTGLNEILEESGAPRGSLYYHFPGGKEELAVAVIKRHGELVRDGLGSILSSRDNVLRAMSDSLDLMAHTSAALDYAPGCPVSTIALEMGAQSPELRVAAETAFESWRSVVARRLVVVGMAPRKAAQRARVLVSTMVGAVVLSRAYGDFSPLHDVKKALPSLIEG